MTISKCAGLEGPPPPRSLNAGATPFELRVWVLKLQKESRGNWGLWFNSGGDWGLVAPKSSTNLENFQRCNFKLGLNSATALLRCSNDSVSDQGLRLRV